MNAPAPHHDGRRTPGPIANTVLQRANLNAMRIYLLAIMVGALAGTLGSAFHFCVERVFDLHASFASRLSTDGLPSPVVTGAIGMAMVVVAFAIVRRIAPEAAGSGIQEIEGAMAELRSLRWSRVLPVKFFAGVLAIGSGLVLGREGPTIHIGGCVGRMVGAWMKLRTDAIHTLVAAGAAAGLSTAFGAPLAGVLFVTEEMRRRFNYTFVSLHAVALASFTANIVNDTVFGIGPALPLDLKGIVDLGPTDPHRIAWFVPVFVCLGVVVGACGAGFNAGLLATLKATDRLTTSAKFCFVAACGAGAGVLVAIAPPFVSGGESVVQMDFLNPPVLGFLAILLVARTVTTFLSYSCSVPGGIFAPMLALGCIIGMCFAHFAHAIVPGMDVHAGAFALAAMGGLFAASVRAPLTGIVLVAELTSSFAMWPALIITSITASITAQAFRSAPVYDLLLERTLDPARTR